MRRTDVTYGQLDKILRSLGFSCRLVDKEPPVRAYEHKQTGAEIRIPPYPTDDRVLEHHLVTARVMLDEFGIAEPNEFEAKLQKRRSRNKNQSQDRGERPGDGSGGLKRTEFTYGQLDRTLRSLGFSCRLVKGDPPARVYEHKETGASVTTPPFPETDFVLAYHLVAARTIADLFGVAEPNEFDATLQKGG
jgi:hypothetical protein